MTKPTLLLTAAALLLGACADLSGWNREAATPARAPGEWLVALDFDGAAHPLPVSRICLDRASDARLAIVGAQMDRGQCSTYQVGRVAHGQWRLHSVCQIAGGASVTTDAEIFGEPDARWWDQTYWARASGVETGAADASQNGTHSVVLTARRVGACDAGRRGGDITVNGRTANIFAAG
ncbi:MAG TPA: DUF3617 family protein [Caulobacteraceae bacterium]|jgi:hypothetical protein|nr:DUF3617 family protein [Caulobacteraceae bacterium]